MTADVKQIGKLVQQKSEFIRLLLSELDKVIVGQRYMLERMLVACWPTGTSCWRACRGWPRRWP